MKHFVLGIVFATAILAQRPTVKKVAAAPAISTPRISRNAMAALEKSIDERVLHLWTEHPWVLLGNTRGVYVQGFGTVLTAEINLVTGPTMMMRTGVTAEEKAAHRVKRIKRFPELRAELRKVLMDAASTLETMPAEENLVFCAFLSKYPWEDVSGLPAQLILTGQKKKLLEAKAAGGAGLDQIIRVEEY
jgi:hypothetical protein